MEASQNIRIRNDAMNKTAWFLLRLCVIIFTACGFFACPASQSNLGWIGCFLISILPSVGLYIWLGLAKTYRKLELSNPFSLTTPFFPMRSHPFEFWAVASYSLILGGGAAVVEVIITRVPINDHVVNVAFLLLGVGILASLVVFKLMEDAAKLKVTKSQ